MAQTAEHNKRKQLEDAYNRGLALEKSGLFAQAAQAYAQVLALDKEDCAGVSVRLAAMGRGETPKAAPPAYIAALFDQYADVFDMILVDALGYDVPNLLRAALDKHYPRRIFKTMLDLGCGTGLVGEAFADMPMQKTGLDLSQNMIEAAHEREVYDRLFVGDIVRFLTTASAAEQKGQKETAPKETWDLIFAADVLPYMGDLSQFFAAAAFVLPQGGVFGFSSENLEKTALAAPAEQQSALPQSGRPQKRQGDELKAEFAVGLHQRFAHAPHYIEQCLAEAGLKRSACMDIIVRKEQNEPVFGQLFLAEKL